MVFHLVLNSLLVFILLAFFIECILYVSRVKNFRLRYICRSLPILKIPFDLLLFSFYDELPFINLNPFSCQIFAEEFMTKLLPTAIQSDTSTGEHLIIPRYIAMHLPNSIVQGIVFLTIVLSTTVVSRRIYEYFTFRRDLKQFLKTSHHCDRVIHNGKLQEMLKKMKAVILISTHVAIPFAADLHYIFFPKDLSEELSQEEFEAVISHELEHLKWKDPLLKFFNSLLCGLAWWIPTSWWIKRLEVDQEQASDMSIWQYGVNPTALASALVKVIQKARYLKYPLSAGCPLDTPKHNHMDRLHTILNANTRNIHTLFSFPYLLTVGCCFLVFICFWMC